MRFRFFTGRFSRQAEGNRQSVELAVSPAHSEPYEAKKGNGKIRVYLRDVIFDYDWLIAVQLFIRFCGEKDAVDTAQRFSLETVVNVNDASPN
jgi:hypothetical protein